MSNPIYINALNSIAANSALATSLLGLSLACIVSLELSPQIASPILRNTTRVITLSIMLAVFIGLMLAQIIGG